MKSAIVTPFRVGLLVITGIAAFFVLLSFLARQKYSDKETYRVYATFNDASGLGPKSRVQIAGIEVGIVDKIELTGDAKARATLRIKKDVPLRLDARITKRSASLLGDFLLDVYPGSPEQRPLRDGDEVGRVVAAPGVDDVFAALGDVTRDIQGITKSLRGLLDSNEVGSIKEIIRSMNEVAQGLNHTIEKAGGRLDNILGDVEALSGDVRGMARGQQHNVEEILANLRSFTEQANKVAASLNNIVGNGEGELKDSVASVRQTLDELQKTLQGAQHTLDGVNGAVADARGVIQRVDKGEGTVGKLLRDDGIAVKLDKTLGDVNALIAPISELQTVVNMREELHYRPALTPSGKAVVQVRLQPKPDKYYGLEVASEPRGKVSRQTVVKTGPQGEVLSNETVATLTDDLKLSAYIAKRYGPVVGRVGLIESTGGVGGDLLLAGDKLRLSVDAFDWANPATAYPRLRTSANFTFLDHLYIGVGADDLLNAALDSADGKHILGGRDAFVTGGLHFTDDDLKAILTVTGAPKVQ